MRWTFALLFLLTACSTLPAPTPPPEGAYGFVRQDDEDAMGGIDGLGVCALPTMNAKGSAIQPDTIQTVTDADGNFTLPLPVGQTFTLCLIDGAFAVKCDCTITIGAGSLFKRYFLRENSFDLSPESWHGQWYGANAQSSCDFMLAD